MNLEKVLSVKVLIALNIAIIAGAELTGDLFLRTGLIHIIALVFLVLGISRIFVHYTAFDQYLKPLIFGSVAALLLFSFSHLTEYFSFSSGSEPYSDALYVDVTNMYMTAMLLVALAAQYFLAKRSGSSVLLWVLSGGFILSCALTILGFFRIFTVSIEPDEWYVYAYAFLVVVVTALSTTRLLGLGKAVSIITSFTMYIAVSFFLIAAAALQYLLYEILEHAGIPEVQIIYISHFLFYVALSCIFLAFPRIAQLGGIYESPK